MSFVDLLVKTNAVFRIVGVSFHQDAVSTLSEGQRLRLVRDENNAHDPNAIRVETENGATLGHVPADLARRIRSGDESQSYLAEVMALRTYEGQTVGADIRVVAGRA